MGITKIVLADDHHIVRHGLRVLLQVEPDFSIIGEASDGLETLEMVENLKPDVLVLDLMMPIMNGLEVTRQVSRRSPQSHVVILSMYGNEPYVLEAMHAGAKAYVLKASTTDELVLAIRKAAIGQRYLSPPLSELAIEAYLEKAKDDILDPYEMLTSREKEVLHLVAEGTTNARIATWLGVSPRTVETHRSNLMRKVGLRSQTDLIRYALKQGILPPSE